MQLSHDFKVSAILAVRLLLVLAVALAIGAVRSSVEASGRGMERAAGPPGLAVVATAEVR